MSTTPRSFTDFRETRQETLRLAAGLGQPQLDYSPSARSWSVGEVLDHLIQVDRVFRGEYDELLRLYKKRPGSVNLFRSLSDAGFKLPLVPDVLLPFFDIPVAVAGVMVPRPLRQALFSNRAVPARAPDRIRPKKGRPAAELRAELEEFLEYLERYFADNPDVEWRRLHYYNPLCGLTDLPGAMSFVGSHERRHQEQIREILEGKGFPAADAE